VSTELWSSRQRRGQKVDECVRVSWGRERSRDEELPGTNAFAISWVWQRILPIHPYHNAEILIMRYYDKTRTIRPYWMSDPPSAMPPRGETCLTTPLMAAKSTSNAPTDTHASMRVWLTNFDVSARKLFTDFITSPESDVVAALYYRRTSLADNDC